MARKIKFKNGEYYHIYNRGVDKRQIFTNNNDYIRFINSINRFNQDLVSFTAYNLVENHFHFKLKQLSDYGISKFMHKLGTGYTIYFNKKYDRSGSLFENVFKATHIDSESYLIWLSGYIHNNTKKHDIAENEDWIWSSYSQYLYNNSGEHLVRVDKDIVLSNFDNIKSYKNFVSDFEA